MLIYLNHLPTYLSSAYCLSVCLSIICLLSVYLSVCLSVYHLPIVCLSIYLPSAYCLSFCRLPTYLLAYVSQTLKLPAGFSLRALSGPGLEPKFSKASAHDLGYVTSHLGAFAVFCICETGSTGVLTCSVEIWVKGPSPPAARSLLLHGRAAARREREQEPGLAVRSKGKRRDPRRFESGAFRSVLASRGDLGSLLLSPGGQEGPETSWVCCQRGGARRGRPR